jgi:hypothetical protein
MKKLLLVLFFLSLLFISCRKRRDAPALTKENIAGIYKITSITSRDSPDSPEYDALADDPPCIKDNLYTFTVDNKLICTDAGLQCEPQAQWTINWSLAEDSHNYHWIQSRRHHKIHWLALEITLNWSEAYDKITYTSNSRRRLHHNLSRKMLDRKHRTI